MVVEYESLGQKIRKAYKTGGLRVLLLRFAKMGKKRLFQYHTSYWYIRDLDRPIDEIAATTNLEVFFDSMNDTLSWEKAELRDGFFTLDDYKEIRVAEENKHEYILVKSGGEIVGFLKVGFGEVFFKEYNSSLAIPKEIAFIYDTYVSEKHRGKKIAPFLINEAMKNLSDKGYSYMSCHIVPENSASRRAYAKISFEEIKLILHLRILGIRIFNLRPDKLLRNFLEERTITR